MLLNNKLFNPSTGYNYINTDDLTLQDKPLPHLTRGERVTIGEKDIDSTICAMDRLAAMAKKGKSSVNTGEAINETVSELSNRETYLKGLQEYRERWYEGPLDEGIQQKSERPEQMQDEWQIAIQKHLETWD